MSKQPWALILGASSGFGEATALELARAGMNIFGVHLDRREKLPHVAEILEKIRALGREVHFFNCNAADDEKRKDTVTQMTALMSDPPGTLRVLLHSLAFGALKPLAGAQEVATRHQIELTADIMGHSLVFWVQECLWAGLLDRGSRIFAMTSSGGTKAIPNYGPVSAAKAILESHIRQLAVELAPAGITANAILAGVRKADGDRKDAQSAQAAHYGRGRGALHRRVEPSGHLLAHRQYAPGGWRGEHCRMSAMVENGLPCLDLLDATPGILRSLMCELSEEDARWKPAPDRFSVAEVLAHLSHSEGHCYRARVDRFLNEDRPVFEPDDAQMHLDRYRDADAEDAFDHFEDQRETNVEFLRDLPESAGKRVALHKEAGEITLAQMLHEWAMHDLGHIRQVAELVRARKHQAAAGPLGSSYNLKP
jgi:enoyl-[acyl-carrier protein] reductase III